MTRTLLTAIFSTLFSQAAWADSVYYCIGTNLAEIRGANLQSYTPQKFKFNVNQNRIRFGSDGFFSGSEFPISSWIAENFWTAYETDYAILKFYKGEFMFASSAFEIDGATGMLISAKCDKF